MRGICKYCGREGVHCHFAYGNIMCKECWDEGRWRMVGE